MIPLEDLTVEDEDDDDDDDDESWWWWWLSSHESYLVKKGYLVMKVIIVKRSDDLSRFACGYGSQLFKKQMSGHFTTHFVCVKNTPPSPSFLSPDSLEVKKVFGECSGMLKMWG